MNGTSSLWISGCLLWTTLAGGAAAAQVYYSKPDFVSESTGLLESLDAGDWYRGTGVVTRDARLIYSCAHLFYDRGQWATDYNFYRAVDRLSYPDEATAAVPRGLRYFTSYSSGVKSYGTDSDQAFASDFTVLYGNDSFGTPVSWWSSAGPALRSSRLKRIVGYPSKIDYTGANGHCYQHSTGWFRYAGVRYAGNYHDFDDVSTGPGNSGGPIFVQDDSGKERLAGILVSGSTRTAGVIGLNLATHSLASYALGYQDQTLTFSNNASYSLPDASKTYKVIPIKVSGYTGSVSGLRFSIAVDTKRSGNLDVYLKSPAGRTCWVVRHGSGTTGNLDISGRNLTSRYFGSVPNGTWEVHIRDAVSGNRSTFRNASLVISAI